MNRANIRKRPQKRTLPPTREERDFYARLIEALIETRKRRGLSQSALDDMIGISEGCTAKWESLVRIPGAFYLMCWCKALGVEIVIRERRR
jgi:ribosome-binding protein aMBF1 (putative translation factor)